MPNEHLCDENILKELIVIIFFNVVYFGYLNVRFSQL